MGKGKFCLRIGVSVQTPCVHLVGGQAEREVRTESDTVGPSLSRSGKDRSGSVPVDPYHSCGL